MKYIIQMYQEKFSNKFTKLAVFSDGCAEQYKSSHAAHEMTFLRAETNIQEIIHTYAPTAQFKCCCDSAGSDTKTFMKRAERNGQVRATTSWEVFVYLHANMPKPNPAQNRLSQFKITDRNNYYVVREQETTGEMLDWMQKPSHNVVFLRDSVGEKNGQKLTGIRGIYQIRVDNSMEEQCIMHRNITCACNSCVHSDYASCATNSTWTAKNLSREDIESQAAIRARGIEVHEQRFDQEAVRREERTQSRYTIGDMNETWAASKEISNRRFQERGLRIANREAAIDSQQQPTKRKRK